MKFSLFSVVDHYPGRPRSVADYYAQFFRTTAEGEKLGYDAMLVAEHHFHEYGVVPNPAGIELKDATNRLHSKQKLRHRFDLKSNRCTAQLSQNDVGRNFTAAL